MTLLELFCLLIGIPAFVTLCAMIYHALRNDDSYWYGP